MTKPTSGPWLASNNLVGGPDGKWIADCYEFGRDFDERCANANFIALARTALEQVEWVYGGLFEACPWCHGHKATGHKSDCIRQKALGL